MGAFASLDLTDELSNNISIQTQSGLAPSVSSTSIAQILNTKSVNYYGNIGNKWFYNPNKLVLWWLYYCKWGYIDNQVV